MKKTWTGTRPIEKLKAGDRVLSFDDKEKITVSTVGKTLHHTATGYVELKAENGTTSVTDSHPIYVGHGFVESAKQPGFKKAKGLKAGDKVYVLSAEKTLKEVSIQSTLRIKKKVQVFNIHISSGPPTYFANSLAVHNK